MTLEDLENDFGLVNASISDLQLDMSNGFHDVAMNFSKFHPSLGKLTNPKTSIENPFEFIWNLLKLSFEI